MAGTRGKCAAVRIYTKTGDDGSTGLLGAGRVSKDDLRVEVYGTVDEVNAALGVARAHGLDPEADALIARLQDELFVLGSALADPSPDGPFHHAITPRHVAGLESAIDGLEEELEPLAQFILPGGSPPAAPASPISSGKATEMVMSEPRWSPDPARTKAVLITGGRRVGSDLALMLAGRGWDVAMTYRTSREAIERTIARVEERGGKGLAIAA